MSYLKNSKNVVSRGFTLLEMLLVIAIIAILAAIVIVAINPAKQLGDANNAQRQSDVLAILNAVHQYAIDHSGDLSDLSITETIDPDCVADGDGICTDGSCDTDQGVDNGDLYTELAVDGIYLSDIPRDPSADGEADLDSDDSGYQIIADEDTGRITVCAPLTENTEAPLNEEIISVTR